MCDVDSPLTCALSLLNKLHQVNQEYTLTDGDVAGFDFNREVHYIKNNEDAVNAEPRITLKLHYVVYPKCLWPLGKLLALLTTGYDFLRLSPPSSELHLWADDPSVPMRERMRADVRSERFRWVLGEVQGALTVLPSWSKPGAHVP